MDYGYPRGKKKRKKVVKKKKKKKKNSERNQPVDFFYSVT